MAAAPNKKAVSKEVELLRGHLSKKGLKLTQQRETILTAFLGADHITAEELYQGLSRKHHRLGLATVYRTLNLLCEIGIGQQRHFTENKTIFDNVVHKRHHDHLICSRCDKIIEFECPDIERLQEEMAAKHGFTLRTHRLELYGQCRDCGDHTDKKRPSTR